MSRPYYQHPLFGLILYVFSHILGISYLTWMLIGKIEIIPEEF